MTAKDIVKSILEGKDIRMTLREGEGLTSSVKQAEDIYNEIVAKLAQVQLSLKDDRRPITCIDPESGEVLWSGTYEDMRLNWLDYNQVIEDYNGALQITIDCPAAEEVISNDILGRVMEDYYYEVTDMIIDKGIQVDDEKFADGAYLLFIAILDSDIASML